MSSRMVEALFTEDMVKGWQHSEKCLAGRKDVCICGLTAVQAAIQGMGRKVFNIWLDHPEKGAK